MAKKRKSSAKPSSKPSMTNPAGPVDKTVENRDVPGISDDTRVVYANENGVDDG